MSKFERYKKKSINYIYPHKHCQRCGQMIDESMKFCENCYKIIKEKKEKKRFRFKRKNKTKKNRKN